MDTIIHWKYIDNVDKHVDKAGKQQLQKKTNMATPSRYKTLNATKTRAYTLLRRKLRRVSYIYD